MKRAREMTHAALGGSPELYGNLCRDGHSPICERVTKAIARYTATLERIQRGEWITCTPIGGTHAPDCIMSIVAKALLAPPSPVVEPGAGENLGPKLSPLAEAWAIAVDVAMQHLGRNPEACMAATEVARRIALLLPSPLDQPAPPPTVPPGSEAGQGDVIAYSVSAVVPGCARPGQLCRSPIACAGAQRCTGGVVPAPPPEVPPAGETDPLMDEAMRISYRLGKLTGVTCEAWPGLPVGRVLVQDGAATDSRPCPGCPRCKPAPAPGVLAVCGTCGGKLVVLALCPTCQSPTQARCNDCREVFAGTCGTCTGRPTGERGTG